jgi:DNA mismatch repair protein MutS
VMAQCGSFVPAKRATIPVMDAILTRIGANDDLAGGRSTFFVEAEELAGILRTATPRSLVLLDEVGRGTSTYDGLAVATATTEFLHDTARAFTLFATHYFELTLVADGLVRAQNLHVAAEERDGELVFYHQVLPGPASKSYGIEVARLAGMPASVVAREGCPKFASEGYLTLRPSLTNFRFCLIPVPDALMSSLPQGDQSRARTFSID